jgi:uncharacterized membrane protein
MKKQTWFYWIPTSLLLLVMVGSGVMYFLNSADVAKIFTQLGYPVYTMYFNALAKILGGVAIVVPSIPRVLKEWAYAGYLFIMLLAMQAIYMTGTSLQWLTMLPFIAIWGLSYWRFTKRA